MDPKLIYENFRLTVTQHYFDMNGRVSRPDFWYFVLACFVVGVVAAILSIILFIPLRAVVGLALLLPMAGMGARRLQDAGQNGQLVWVLLIPSAILQLFSLMIWGPFGIWGFAAFYLSIGWIINLLVLVALVACIYFWVQPGTHRDNAYGPPPHSMM